jgi:hypothetical protein
MVKAIPLKISNIYFPRNLISTIGLIYLKTKKCGLYKSETFPQIAKKIQSSIETKIYQKFSVYFFLFIWIQFPANTQTKMMNWCSSVFSLFNSCFSASSNHGNLKEDSTTAAKPSSPQAALVAAAKHFSSAHKVNFS